MVTCVTEATAGLYASKTLQFITGNAKVLSDKNFNSLVSECVTIAAKIKSISENEQISKSEQISAGQF